jgi:hypothetical protein
MKANFLSAESLSSAWPDGCGLFHHYSDIGYFVLLYDGAVPIAGV